MAFGHVRQDEVSPSPRSRDKIKEFPLALTPHATSLIPRITPCLEQVDVVTMRREEGNVVAAAPCRCVPDEKLKSSEATRSVHIVSPGISEFEQLFSLATRINSVW